MATNAKADTGREVTTIDPDTGEVLAQGRAMLPSAATYGEARRVSDLIRTPDEWAEYDQVARDTLIDRDIVLLDCMIFDSQDYEDKRYAIVLFRDPETNHFATTISGGDVFVRKLDALTKMKMPNGTIGAFPCVGRIREVPSKVRGHQPYIDLV